MSSSNALDVQVGGSHYKSCPIQPIEYCMANNLNACQSAIVKYITRYKDKNGKEDLNKIKHYVDLLIALEYPRDKTDWPTTPNDSKRRTQIGQNGNCGAPYLAPIEYNTQDR